jgi:hypothetical protein
MSLDPWWILVQMVVSGAGYVLFTFGRRQERLPHLLAGLLLMALPFFALTATAALIGASLVALGTWWAVRLGW